MVRCNWSRQTTKRTSASLVLASLVLLAAHGVPSARSQPAAQTNSNGYYFVCSFPTNSGGVLTYYISAVNGVPPGVEPGQFLDQLSHGFDKFVAAKYNTSPKLGASCVYQFSQATAEALRQRNLTQAAKGYKAVVDTGWKYGDAAPAATAAATAPPAAPIHPAAASVAAPPTGPASLAQAAPVSTTIVMRLVDTILSVTDPPGMHYRAVVTQASTAGSVSIPVNTQAQITLVQSGGNWSARLTSLSLNGRTVAVTSSSVSATSPMQQIQQRVQKLGGLLKGVGGFGDNVAPHALVNTAIATGPRVELPTGTALTFTAAVPQLLAQAAPGSSAGPPAPGGTTAAPMVVSAAGQGSVAASQTAGGPAAICEQEIASPGAQAKFYVSAIFDVPNGNDRNKWQLAWAYHVRSIDPSPYTSGGGCTFFPTRAGAQRYLENRKKNLVNAKLVDTGWAYTGS